MKKLDVLVFSVHPDDAELGCSGTICKLISEGKKVGIIDLTRGELGTRGTPELRTQEAEAASKIMGIHVRENLGFRDGFFVHDEKHQHDIIQMVRKYQPQVVITNAPHDRHPDHGRASKLVRDAVFLSGLRKIETNDAGQSQEAWRPKRLFFFIQDYYLEPSFVIDITDFYQQKMKAISAFGSQFNSPDTSKEPETYISNSNFWNFLEARSRTMGHKIGVTHGEGFIAESMIKIKDLMDLV